MGRYANMHTTALCSPTRSCILTGRNHHSNGMSCITEGSEGYPGSNGLIPFENGFLSEILAPHGYNTYAVGNSPEQIRGVTQSPIQGVSFAHTFDDAKAQTKHHTQYFEMFAHRSIYHESGGERWRAVCPFPGPSFTEAKAYFGELTLTEEKLRELDAKGWELYNLDDDPAETKNLADTRRDKLIEMIALWYSEAGKYNVFPLDSRGTSRLAAERPQLAGERKIYVYYPHTQAVPDNVAVRTLNRARSFTAEVEIPKGGAEGVIICQGGNIGGYTFFITFKVTADVSGKMIQDKEEEAKAQAKVMMARQ
jgi:Sulfatase